MAQYCLIPATESRVVLQADKSHVDLVPIPISIPIIKEKAGDTGTSCCAFVVPSKPIRPEIQKTLILQGVEMATRTGLEPVLPP